MIMKYRWIGTSKDGIEVDGETTVPVSCENEGLDMIDKWNVQGKRGGYPKWHYELLGFELGHTLVNSSKRVLDCWSPLRHKQLCWKCQRVELCKLKEAWYGRLELARKKMLRLEEKYNKALWDFLKMAGKGPNNE